MMTFLTGRMVSRRSVLGLGLAALLILSGGPALAQSLNDLRASGAVGEAFDGYARARDGAYRSLVQQTNAKRRAIYEKRANSQGVDAAQVGRVYAQQIMSKAPPGTWFLSESGSWSQK